MRRLAGALLLFALVFGAPPPAGAAGPFEFRFGFKALADSIPGVVGSPLEDEWHDPTTGDARQRTTTGELVWRKTDNVAAFTDGATTWLLGPLGLQSRSNDVRFPWETPSAVQPPAEPLLLVFTRGQDGIWQAAGDFKNLTPAPLDAEINVIGYTTQGGTPLVAPTSLFVSGLAPGASRQVSLRIAAPAEVGAWTWTVQARPSGRFSLHTTNLGEGRRLSVDTMLAGAVEELKKVPRGEALLRTASEHDVQVGVTRMDAGVLGEFNPRYNRLTLNSDLGSTSAWVRATVLAHELQHAADSSEGRYPSSSLQCYRLEANAFKVQAAVWNALWKGHLPPSSGQLHEEMNALARLVAADSQGFAVQLTSRYQSECGLLPDPSQILSSRQ